MAYPPGMELHGSGWRINKRVPKDLLAHYAPKKILRYKTSESDKRAAAALAWRWLTEQEEEFLRIRNTGSRFKQAITPEEVSHLVRLMVRSSLEAHEQSRDAGDYACDVAFSTALQHLEQTEAENRQALSRGILEGNLPEITGDWLRSYGYDIPSDSPAFRAVCIAFAKGRAEAVEARRARNDGRWVDTPPSPAMPQPEAIKSAATSVPLLSEVVKSFLDKQDSARPMFAKYAATLKLFLEVLGDRPVSDIRQADIDGFCAFLCKLPPRWRDEARKRKVGAIALAAMPWPAVINRKTFEDSYVASLRPFLVESRRLYSDQGFPGHLTTGGIKYSGDRDGGEHKQRAMLLEELKRLFEGAEARAFAADPEQVHCYWLPLVGLYTGARVNEVCQLNPQHDFVEEGGIWCFNFTEETEGDTRINKSIKNKTSRRKVPLHSRLLELGLLGYVERMRRAGHALLFPQWAPTRGKASGKAEKWFRDHLVALGLRDETPGKRVVGFHAFRSTFLNRALNLGVANAEWLTGHTQESVSAVVREYQGEAEAAKKREVLERITFNLDIPVP